MEREKNNNVIVIILILVIVLLGAFIVYDKVLKKNDSNKSNNSCECEKCTERYIDYSTFNINTSVPLVCTIDMTSLSNVDVASKCGDSFANNGSYQIKVENLKYNDIAYTFTYIMEKDSYFPRESDSGIIKMYIGSTLIDAHDGSMRNILESIKVNENNLHISEWAPSNVPKYESDFDLAKIIK